MLATLAVAKVDRGQSSSPSVADTSGTTQPSRPAAAPEPPLGAPTAQPRWVTTCLDLCAAGSPPVCSRLRFAPPRRFRAKPLRRSSKPSRRCSEARARLFLAAARRLTSSATTSRTPAGRTNTSTPKARASRTSKFATPWAARRTTGGTKAPSAASPLPAAVAIGQTDPPRGWLSRYYGEKTAVPSIAVTPQCQLPVTLVSVLGPRVQNVHVAGSAWSIETELGSLSFDLQHGRFQNFHCQPLCSSLS